MPWPHPLQGDGKLETLPKAVLGFFLSIFLFVPAFLNSYLPEWPPEASQEMLCGTYPSQVNGDREEKVSPCPLISPQPPGTSKAEEGL